MISPRYIAVFATLACLLPFALPAQNRWQNFESPQLHPLELTADGTRLLAVNTADQRLEVFAVAADGSLTLQRSIAVGMEPVSVRARSSTEAWVVNHLSDSITVVDPSSGAVLRSIATGDEPADVVFAGSPQRAFVTLSRLDQVKVYDPANAAAAPATIALNGSEPRALAVSPAGDKVYVGFFQSGNLTTMVSQASVSNAGGPYAGQNPPPNSGAAFDPPRPGGGPLPPPVAQIVRRDAAGAWRDDNNRNWSSFVNWNLLDHDLAAIDAGTLAVNYVDSLMTTVMALSVKPDGRVAAVGTEARNEVRFEPNARGTFIRVRLASFAALTPADKQIVDLNPQLHYSVRSVSAATRAQAIGDPRGIVWTASGDVAFVSGMGSNNVIATQADGQRVARIDVGEGPTGLALNAAGTRLYVLNRFAASISVVDVAARAELARVAFFDPTPATVKQGRPLIYDTHATSGLGQASCASCHLDSRTDGLAWDLGDPSGTVKNVNQPCFRGQCPAWHPMKGPMLTQSLQDIVGSGPMHWRGDRENVAAFGPAFVSLLGADAVPNTASLQHAEDFLATVKYPPNPNRNLDGSLPASVVTTNGTGDPTSGLNLYQTLPVLGPGDTCQLCHALPIGSSNQIFFPPNAPLSPQSMRQSQLRGLYERSGFSSASQNNRKGFGFNHHSEFDSLFALLSDPAFQWGPQNQAAQRKRDVEAFLIVLDTGTPAAVGQQVVFDGSNNTTVSDVARLNTFVTLANAGGVGLIAKTRDTGGTERGYTYATQSVLLSDQVNLATTPDALRLGATAARPVVFTVVGAFTQYRAGVDRDADGWLDADERVHGGNASDAQVAPSGVCRPDFDGNGNLELGDRTAFLAAHAAGQVRANYDLSLGTNGLPSITTADRDAFQTDYDRGCELAQFADGFE